MRIRLTRSGINVDGATRVRGAVVDVEADTAELLCSTGQAVPLDHERTATDPDVEVAAQTTAERTSARPARRRPRERR